MADFQFISSTMQHEIRALHARAPSKGYHVSPTASLPDDKSKEGRKEGRKMGRPTTNFHKVHRSFPFPVAGRGRHLSTMDGGML